MCVCASVCAQIVIRRLKTLRHFARAIEEWQRKKASNMTEDRISFGHRDLSQKKISKKSASVCGFSVFISIHLTQITWNSVRRYALIARAASPFLIPIVCTVDQYRWKCFTLHSFVRYSFLSAKRHDRRIEKVFRSICRSPFLTSFCIFSSAIAIKHKRRSDKVMDGKNNGGKMKRNGLCNRTQYEVGQRRRTKRAETITMVERMATILKPISFESC